MITTPEQMREAAAQCCDQFDGPACNSAFVMGQATAAQQIRAAIRAIPITPQPADPLSDPRVVALVEAVKAADTHIDKGHYEMARNITRAALRAIGGEA